MKLQADHECERGGLTSCSYAVFAEWLIPRFLLEDECKREWCRDS